MKSVGLRAEQGLRIGVQIAGWPWQEEVVLAVAAKLIAESRLRVRFLRRVQCTASARVDAVGLIRDGPAFVIIQRRYSPITR
jgi:hypothetical protein